MNRCTFFSFLIATASACASQPICKPWSPDVAPPPAAMASAPAAAVAPPVLDDGSTALAGPSSDDTWSTIVGEGALPASRNSRATRSARAKSAAVIAQPAVATSTVPVIPPAAGAATERPLFGSPGYGLPDPTRPAAANRATATKRMTRSAAVTTKPEAPVGKPAPAPAPAPPPPAPPPAVKAAAVPAPKPAPPKPAASEDKPTPEARAFFAGRCAMCHGDAGRGDGPAGKALNPQPRNFTDRGWQAAVTDQHIEKVILNGGPSVGKSPLMPPHGDLANNPALLKAMRALVRELGR